MRRRGLTLAAARGRSDGGSAASRIWHQSRSSMKRRSFGHGEKVEQNLPLRREQAGMDRRAVAGLVDIVGDHPLQKGARPRACDADHRAIGKNRHFALAHVRSSACQVLKTYLSGHKPER
jgi:hypothetical protein